MVLDGNQSTSAEVLDFESGRQRRDRQAACAEVRGQLERLLDGDRVAAAWLYDSFSPSLFRRLRQRYAHLKIDPNDLLHDAFIFYFQRDGKVLRDFLERVAPQDQTPGRLERHLWDLACGIASNHRRAAALRDSQSLEADGVGAELEDDRQEKLLLDRDELNRLDECLREGDSKLYLYYKLRYWDGFSPSEISAMTGWSRKVTYKLRQSLNEAVRECAERLGIPCR